MGFEPTTAGATIQSSAELSYGHHTLLRTASIANGLGIVNSRTASYSFGTNAQRLPVSTLIRVVALPTWDQIDRGNYAPLRAAYIIPPHRCARNSGSL